MIRSGHHDAFRPVFPKQKKQDGYHEYFNMLLPEYQFIPVLSFFHKQGYC
jgi:hypothetical protein